MHAESQSRFAVQKLIPDHIRLGKPFLPLRRTLIPFLQYSPFFRTEGIRGLHRRELHRGGLHTRLVRCISSLYSLCSLYTLPGRGFSLCFFRQQTIPLRLIEESRFRFSARAVYFVGRYRLRMMRAVIDTGQQNPFFRQFLSHIAMHIFRVFFCIISSSDSCLIGEHNKRKSAVIQALHSFYDSRKKTKVLYLMQVGDFLIDGSIPIQKYGFLQHNGTLLLFCNFPYGTSHYTIFPDWTSS